MATPLSTTSANGCASTAASATASGVEPSALAAAASSAAGARGPRRPLASASLMITSRPASWARPSAGPAARSCRFQVAWTASNIPSATARSIVSACEVPLTDTPMATPLARRSRSSSSTSSFSSTPLSGVAEWIW